MLGELHHELLHFVAAFNSVPEHNFSFPGKASFGFVEEPCQVLVIFLDGPHTLRVVFLDACEDVVRNIGKPPRFSDGESSQLCY